METHTLDRWKPALQNAAAAVFAVGIVWILSGEPPVVVIVVAVAVLGWAWWVSPLHRGKPHVPHAQAQSDAGPDDLIVYWRSGCTYCIKLRRRLSDEVADAALWVNVMTDAEGGAYIRQFNDGDMVTPTAVTGSGMTIEADAASITAHVAAHG